MAKLRSQAHIGDSQGIDITTYVTPCQYDIAISLSDDSLTCSCFKFILVFCVGWKQVSVAKKIVCCPLVNDNRGNQGGISSRCDRTQCWYSANFCLWFRMALGFLDNAAHVFRLWLRGMWQRRSWCIGQFFRTFGWDMADIVTDKPLSSRMPTVSLVFSSASLTLLIFLLFLVWVKQGAFFNTLFICLIAWFGLDLELQVKFTFLFFLFETHLFDLQSLCQFT